MGSAFVFPAIHDFPPFYTRQEHEETWARQQALWSDIILAYVRHHRIVELDVDEQLSSALFANAKIQRRAGPELARLLVDYLVQCGNSEWVEGRKKGRALVWWRRPEEWARIIADYAKDRGLGGSVCTRYELLEGEDVADQEFYKMSPALWTKVAGELERTGRARVFSTGSSATDIGIKFSE
jgi:ESCRT-II complex subunit VPS25